MVDFEKLIDLAAERLGGTVCFASDDLLATKENRLRPGRGELISGKYTDNGEGMDGWESRRRRDDGHHWTLLRLGVPGRPRGVDVDVDTNHFLGNAPKSIRLESSTHFDRCMPTSALLANDSEWTEILGDSPTKRGSQSLFPVTDDRACTQLESHGCPDGGVARFRVYGDSERNGQQQMAEARDFDRATATALAADTWRPLVTRTKLEAHPRHELPLADGAVDLGVVSRGGLNILPAGGVARPRHCGEPVA
jgi:allantoicase